MKYLVLAALGLALSGCTSKPLCEPARTGASAVAEAAKQHLGCTNTAAIKEDLDVLLKDAGVCQSNDIGIKGLVGNLVCAPAVDGFAKEMLKHEKVVKYGCTGGPLLDDAKRKLIEMCKAKFPF